MENTSSMQKSWRTKYVINPRFQLYMVGFALFQCLFTVGVLYGLNVFFFNRFTTMGVEAGIPAQHIYFQFLKEQQVFFGQAVIVISVLIGSVILATMTVVSHRIAGPLYRLTKHMQGVVEGRKLSDISFRKKDFFPEIAEMFNLMVLRLKEDELKVSTEENNKDKNGNEAA